MVGHNCARHKYTDAFKSTQLDIGTQGVQAGVSWAEGWGNIGVYFNASDSNDTYTGTTVRPESICTKFYVKY